MPKINESIFLAGIVKSFISKGKYTGRYTFLYIFSHPLITSFFYLYTHTLTDLYIYIYTN